MLTGHVEAVYQVAWSSDGRYLVSASKDSTAKLWEVPSGKRAKETLPGHEDEVYALDWSPNGASLANDNSEWNGIMYFICNSDDDGCYGEIESVVEDRNSNATGACTGSAKPH